MDEPNDNYQKLIERLTKNGRGDTLDPTINVQQLVNSAVARLDDIAAIERAHRSELRDLEAKHRDSQQIAEKERVNALLSAAAAAAALDRTRAELTASALAERVDTTAKTIAAQVESTAKAADNAVVATATALNARITPLEQARYEQAGGKEQRSEKRQSDQYVIYLVMAAIGAASFILARLTP